jgi:indolepyruvate ferredoxin oxidoreductase beta subunit
MESLNSVVNVVLAGVGGQGVLVASDILAMTALKANLDVKKSEVHGMAQRGGSVVSHVRFGSQVFSPLIAKGTARFLLAFERLESLRYFEYLAPDARVLVNNQKIIPTTVFSSEIAYPEDIETRIIQRGFHYFEINGTQLADAAGNQRFLNVILLGALAQFLGFNDELWFGSIKERLAEKFFNANRDAFLQGKSVKWSHKND